MAEITLYSNTTALQLSSVSGINPASTTHGGQSFHGDDVALSHAYVYLDDEFNRTGTVVLELYAHTGSFGTTSLPTGPVLATSEPVDLTTVAYGGGYAIPILFTFEDENAYNTQSGIDYVIAINGLSASGSFFVGTVTGSNLGNSSERVGGVWAVDFGSVVDIGLRLYGHNTPEINNVSSVTVNSTSAEIQAQIYAEGASGVIERGFVHSTSPKGLPGDVAPGASGYTGYSSETGSFSLGTFSYLVGGLDVGTSHYIRAFARNSEGYSYSATEIMISTENLTTVTLNNTDPTDMFKVAVDNANTQGSMIAYDGSSTDDTGLSLDYTFTLATALEGIKVAYSLAPAGWYWYIDLGTNIAYFKNTLTTATHKLIKGRHLTNLKLRMSIQNVKNKVYFTGGDIGGGVNLFSYYSDDASINSFGPRIDRRTDNRVTVQETANAYGDGAINAGKNEAYYTEVDVLDSTYDITLFKPGDTVGFRGFGNFIESLILQIVRIDYTPQKVKLYLGTLAPRQTSDIERVKRELLSLQTVNNPTEPS